MSGSGKKSRPSNASVGAGWSSCSKCKKIFSRQLISKHSAEEETGCRPVYPYLKDGNLFCLLNNVSTSTKKIGDLPFIKDKRIASSTIFLSEDVIKECGLKTFGWISLVPVTAADDTRRQEHGNGDLTATTTSRYAFRVWPIPESIGSNQSNLTCVLSAEGFRTNQLVPFTKLDIGGDAPVGLVSLERLTLSVQSVQQLFPPALEITLSLENYDEVDKGSFDSERFVCSFKRLFQDRPVALRSRFKIRFYAQFVHFYISKLEGALTTAAVSEQSKSDNLTEEFKNLTIKSSPTPPFLRIRSTTVVNIINSENSAIGQDQDVVPSSSDISLKDVGGLEAVVTELCSTVKFILQNPNVPKGILFYGHIGVGKTHLVKAICNEFKLFQIHYEEFKTFSVAGNNDRVMRSSSLEKIFKDATSRCPSVIVVEGLDIIAPSKSSDVGATSTTQFVSTFSRLVCDPRFQQSKVVIICTATNVDKVDPSMRSSNIFAKEIEIPVPSAPQREDILRRILSHINHSLTEEDIKTLAGGTHGFVAADLRSLCNQASLDAVANQSSGDDVPVVSIENFRKCIKSVKPSAIKSILIDIPNVKWDDIGGQTDLKFKLKQAIEWPLKHPEAFKRLGINPPKGILMYGPPGCSKTMIAKAIATESGLNFISVKGSELFSKWVGESEKSVQAIFRKARQVAPCVVFFDEIDSLGGERGTSSGSSNVHERVLAQILVEIDGIEALKDVTIVAATNRPDRIDQALLRPGRLDRIIYVPLPDANTRKDIFRIHFRKMPVDEEVNVDVLVDVTEGYSGAEITAVCHEAALKALEEDININKIRQKHFEEALSMVKPRITEDQIDFYEKYSISRKNV